VVGEQRFPTQSEATAHFFPSTHLIGQLPPQSTSVSLPFLIPSLHEGAVQMKLTQVSPATQLLVEKHFLPVAQPGSVLLVLG
jgi:hypothetical protein